MLDRETFAYVIDRAKAEKGVRSDAELSRATGLSSQLLSYYRKTPSSIPLPNLARICNYLSIPLEERGRLLQ